MNKKVILGCLGILMLSGAMVSCSSSDDNDDPTPTPTPEKTSYTKTTDGGLDAYDGILFDANGTPDLNGTQIGTGAKEVVFNGNRTIKKGTYTLKGWVYVASGATLTIEPGTVIKGDKATQAALIVERGAKLIAKGTQNEPIVFTSAQAKGSRKPGDWGGVILCGKAKTNQGEQQIEGGPRTKHGGNNDADNSGVLSYVRIEFAGYPFQKDKEINGLTLGSVGSGTQIDHVQVSYSNDDSFEWFGGKVNCQYLVAYHGWDDDFDTDNGFSGSVQHIVSIRDPRIADASQSNGFESDNAADGASIEPYTSATFNDVTLIGPMVSDANFKNETSYINGGGENPNNGSSLGLFQAAMHLRRNTRLQISNLVAAGWPIGIIIDNQKGDSQKAFTDGVGFVKNSTLAGCTILGSDFNKVYEDKLITDYKKTTFGDGFSFSHSYFLTAALGNKALDSWAGLNLDYKNFSWTKGWTNWDPQNTDY